MSCAPLRRVVGPNALSGHDDVLGSTSAQTARFYVWGFDPRLQIAVMVYHQPNAGKVVSSSSPGFNVWTALAVVRDGGGTVRDLDTIFSGRALPDGYEFGSAARGIACDVTLYESQALDADAGTWWVVVDVAPEAGVDDAIAQALLAEVRLEMPRPLLTKTQP